MAGFSQLCQNFVNITNMCNIKELGLVLLQISVVIMKRLDESGFFLHALHPGNQQRCLKKNCHAMHPCQLNTIQFAQQTLGRLL